jgi:hypothetical protein
MTKKHRAWTAEQKKLVLDFAKEDGAQAASTKFGVHKSTIYAWQAMPPPAELPESFAEFERYGDMARLIEILTAERDLAQQRLDAAVQTMDMLRLKLTNSPVVVERTEGD